MYAVSGAYKLNTAPYMLNEDTNGMFQVVNAAGTVLEGAAAQDRVVAIVFAPGDSVSGQARTFDSTSLCGKNYEIGGVEVNDYVTEYLEGDGATDNGVLDGGVDTIDQFIQATSTSATESTPYNDRFITITRDEVWAAILERYDFNEKMKNLTEALAKCLSDYAVGNISHRLPWVAPMNLSDYRLNANYNDSDSTSGYAGRFPFLVDDSNAKIDISVPPDELFDMAGCNALAVGSGASAVTANLLDPSVPAVPASPPMPAIPAIPATEYRKLWNNWKDHFFYVVSKAYEPVDVSVANNNAAAVAAAYAAADAAAVAAAAARVTADTASIIKDAAADAASSLAVPDLVAANVAANVASAAAVIITAIAVTDVTTAADASAAATAADVAAAVADVDINVSNNTILAGAETDNTAAATTNAATAAANAATAAADIVDAVVTNNMIAAAAASTAAEAASVSATAAADAADVASATARVAAAAAATTSCAGNCISVNGIEKAGVVIFAGSRQGVQERAGPVAPADADTKSLISNYLENGNESVFPDNAGTGAYSTDINEHMFCIDPGFGVSSC